MTLSKISANYKNIYFVPSENLRMSDIITSLNSNFSNFKYTILIIESSKINDIISYYDIIYIIIIMRTIVDIPDNQVKVLKQLSEQKKISRAKIIRQAITDHIANNTKIASNHKKAFGIWKNTKIDSIAYQRKLRDEWK